ncbi:hypothetical protein KKC88_03595 [Patescibacteria group bacterium]|nr:hypothetical protein [Patescibacteria group bacterium]MBU1673543.1 hypothetical protein [Patescibacteria group bacterium]MBU1963621.1 hypothetical protein [Patescibacteria group bacterium]
MAGKFTISEVLEVTMEMEKESESFFKLGAKSTANPEMKKVFNFLANESRRQYTYYQLFKDTAEQNMSKKKFAGDSDLYLKTLAEESVMTDDKKAKFIIKKDKQDEDIIDFVRDIKKSMLEFLDQIKKELDTSGKEVVEKIITEEKNHIKLMDKLEKSV